MKTQSITIPKVTQEDLEKECFVLPEINDDTNSFTEEVKKSTT